MPHATPLSELSEGPTAMPAATAHPEKKRRVPSKWNKFRWKKKKSKDVVPIMPVSTHPWQLPREDEDWEKEIEESSLKSDRESETNGQSPYDPEDELNLALGEFTLKHLHNGGLSSGPDHYIPAAHHRPPVKWVRHVNHVVVDQFADADE